MPRNVKGMKNNATGHLSGGAPVRISTMTTAHKIKGNIIKTNDILTLALLLSRLLRIPLNVPKIVNAAPII